MPFDETKKQENEKEVPNLEIPETPKVETSVTTPENIPLEIPKKVDEAIQSEGAQLEKLQKEAADEELPEIDIKMDEFGITKQIIESKKKELAKLQEAYNQWPWWKKFWYGKRLNESDYLDVSKLNENHMLIHHIDQLEVEIGRLTQDLIYMTEFEAGVEKEKREKRETEE